MQKLMSQKMGAIHIAILMLLSSSTLVQPKGNSVPVAAPNKTTSQSETVLLRTTATGDEFSILMPVQPTTLIILLPISFKNGAVINEDRTFAAYAGRAVTLVRILKTSKPEKTLEGILESFKNDDKSASIKSIQVITRGGINGRQFDLSNVGVQYKEKYFTRTQCFPTKSQVYVVSVSARDENNPFISHLFSTLKVGNEIYGAEARNPYKVTTDQNVSTSSAQLPAKNQVYKPEEVTHKAVLVWTPVAPFMRVRNDTPFTAGTVKLQMVLSATGQITDIQVVKGQSRTMNEQVIEAVKYMKFIPAEKDGNPVSQLHIFEYSFSR